MPNDGLDPRPVHDDDPTQILIASAVVITGVVDSVSESSVFDASDGEKVTIHFKPSVDVKRVEWLESFDGVMYDVINTYDSPPIAGGKMNRFSTDDVLPKFCKIKVISKNVAGTWTAYAVLRA